VALTPAPTGFGHALSGFNEAVLLSAVTPAAS
jgi:hypothetical protein